MATLRIEPEVESGRSQIVTGEKGQYPRVLPAAGVLMTGLSIAVPSIMMAFIYPLNGAEYRLSSARWGWQGETWWPLIYPMIALSVGLGITGLVLAARRRAPASGATESLRVKAPPWVARQADWLLAFAIMALMLAPVMTLYVASPVPDDYVRTQWISPERVNTPLGTVFTALGVLGIALSVWGATASDPSVTRRWRWPLAVTGFLLALLGNAFVFLLFGFLGLSL